MPERYQSAVDWADLQEGRLFVRDKELSEMVEGMDFVDAIFHTWIMKKPSQGEKRMLNSLLVSFCGGWSIIPPVVFSARLAATTKAPMAQCLAAGFSASGPCHTSAIEEIMGIYRDVPIDGIEGFVEDALRRGKRIPGFGHPVLPKDPRPDMLMRRSEALGTSARGMEKARRISAILSGRKGIHPNIDGMAGAILHDLGFTDPAYGPAFFLMGRSLSMTAHIIEEYRNPPFKALELVYPGFGNIDFKHRRDG